MTSTATEITLVDIAVSRGTLAGECVVPAIDTGTGTSGTTLPMRVLNGMYPVMNPVGTVEYLPTYTSIIANINITLSVTKRDAVVPMIASTDALFGLRQPMKALPLDVFTGYTAQIRFLIRWATVSAFLVC